MMAENKKGPKTFKIIVDHTPHNWQRQFITGMEIKDLAGVDASYGVWQDLPGPEDPPVGDNEKIDLLEPGVERFFTGIKTTTEGKA